MKTLKALVATIVLMASVNAAAGTQCVKPIKWVKSSSEDCLYFKAAGVKDVCVYMFDDAHDGGKQVKIIDRAIKLKRKVKMIGSDTGFDYIDGFCK